MSIVKDVFINISNLALEDWGMALVEPLDETSRSIFDQSDRIYYGTTRFKGVMSGTLAVLCTREFMENIWRNLLGLDYDSEVSDESCEDALKELINVFCGNFLTEAYGDDIVFELVYPLVRPASEDDIDGFFNNKLVLCFLADDQPIALALGDWTRGK